MIGLHADDGLGGLDHLGHASHSAHQDKILDVGCSDLGVLQAGLHRPFDPLEQRLAQLLQLGAGQRKVDVLWPAGVRSDERQVQVVTRGTGQGNLGFLGLFLDALQGVGLVPQIHAVLLLEAVEHPVDDRVVPVVAAELGVAIGGFHLEHAVANLQH